LESLWRQTLEELIDEEAYYLTNKWINSKIIGPLRQKLEEKKWILLEEYLRNKERLFVT
jgi:hypothetical protein